MRCRCTHGLWAHLRDSGESRHCALCPNCDQFHWLVTWSTGAVDAIAVMWGRRP